MSSDEEAEAVVELAYARADALAALGVEITPEMAGRLVDDAIRNLKETQSNGAE